MARDWVYGRGGGLAWLLACLLLCAGMIAGRAQAAPGEGIRVAVTTHLGDGQHFRAGDRVSFLVTHDRDAYLLVLYQDAAGNLLRLLPNRWTGERMYRAGEFMEIPSALAPYDFTIREPFGAETVWVFAAAESLPKLPARELDNGAALLNDGIDAVLKRLREFARERGLAYGEASVGITTAP